MLFPQFPREILLVAVSCVALADCNQKSKSTLPNPKALQRENLVAVNHDEPPIVDTDYRFQLKSPSRKWKLLPLADAQGIVEDASAGMVRQGLSGRGAAYGVVIVEPIGETDVAAYARLLRDSQSGENTTFEPSQQLTFCGKSAVQFRWRARLNGVEVEYVTTCFVHQQFAYSLQLWGAPGSIDERILGQFTEAFSLLKGRVRAVENANHQELPCVRPASEQWTI